MLNQLLVYTVQQASAAAALEAKSEQSKAASGMRNRPNRQSRVLAPIVLKRKLDSNIPTKGLLSQKPKPTKEPEHHVEEVPTVAPHKPQVHMPKEEDLNNWSHHFGAESVNDEYLREATAGTDLVSFVFGLEVRKACSLP